MGRGIVEVGLEMSQHGRTGAYPAVWNRSCCFLLNVLLQVSVNHQSGDFLSHWYQIAGTKIYILNVRK